MKKANKKGGQKPSPSDRETHLVKYSNVPVPPPRSLVQRLTLVRRWVQNGPVANQGFTLSNGHDQFLVITSTLGAAVSIADSWRIKKIQLWAISEGNFPTSVSFTPVGTDITSNNFNDWEQVFEMTSRSQAEPAYMEIIPNRNSPLGGVHFTSNTNFAGVLFQMNISTPGGSNNYRTTMDITFEWVPNFVGLPLGYGRTTATTTLGTLGGEGVMSGFILQGTNSLG